MCLAGVAAGQGGAEAARPTRCQRRFAVAEGQVDLLGDRVDDARSVYKVGDSVEAKIVSVDRKNRGLTLSVKAKDYGDEQEAVKSLKESEQEAASPGTIGDLIKQQMGEN